MPDVAILCPPGYLAGAEEAGIHIRAVEADGDPAGEIRSLAGEGLSLAAVTEDLVPDGKEEFWREAARQGVAVFFIPGPGTEGEGYLAGLREHFAVALGVDIWKATADRAGAEP